MKRAALGMALALALGCAGAPVAPTASVPSPAPAEPGSRLPEFSRPRGYVVNPSAMGGGDLASYRALTRADFLSPEPPEAVRPHRDRLGAYTCGQIRPREGTRLLAKPQRSADGGVVYRAAPERLVFHAYVDRACSWWNDSVSALPAEYVLEHEQIHFALFELTARDMSARGEALEAEIAATGPTAESALAAAQTRMNAVLERELAAALREQMRFDEETSFGFAPEAQARWRQRVDAALAQ